MAEVAEADWVEAKRVVIKNSLMEIKICLFNFYIFVVHG